MRILKRICVSDKTSHCLVSRQAVIILFNELNRHKAEVELDFIHIHMITRAYAEHFHTLKTEFEEKHKVKIHIINASEEIMNMLYIASKTRKLSVDNNSRRSTVKKLTQTYMVSNYFLTD